LRTEATGDFLLEFHHPQVTLGLVIVKGNGEVVDKAEHRHLMSFQSLQEIAGCRATDSPPLFSGFFGRWREGIGGESLHHIRLTPPLQCLTGMPRLTPRGPVTLLPQTPTAFAKTITRRSFTAVVTVFPQLPLQFLHLRLQTMQAL
jgi:hypothetical protein